TTPSAAGTTGCRCTPTARRARATPSTASITTRPTTGTSTAAASGSTSTATPTTSPTATSRTTSTPGGARGRRPRTAPASRAAASCSTRECARGSPHAYGGEDLGGAEHDAAADGAIDPADVADVRQRIAVDDDEVGEQAGGDGAELLV